MEDIDSSPALPSTNHLKRPAPDEDSPLKKPLNLTGTQFIMPTPPDTDQSSNASPSYNNDTSARQGSPAPSSSALSSVGFMSSNGGEQTSSALPATSGTPATSSSGQPPKKRRKLTPDEKIQQQREKDAKAAEKAVKDAKKAAEKAKKDDEEAELKAKRDEEKRIRDEEKRKKAEEREAKKREKELEEQRKQQEKDKKNRSQMRLGAFFQAPATPAQSSGKNTGTGNSASARRRSLSLEPFEAVADQIRRSVSPSKKAVPSQPQSRVATPAKAAKASKSDYDKYFLPFQLHDHCSMPALPVVEDPEAAQDVFDHTVNDPSIRERFDLGLVDSYMSIDQRFSRERQATRGCQMPRMRQLVDQIQGTLQLPIDLTKDDQPQNPVDALQSIPRRYLEFHEDVRPAYYGTYTKISSPRATNRLSRNPFSRTRIDTDYDYDSEAEWEEPEEGEEILDDEEDEAESIGDAHEMDEFLDDAEDAMKSKRKMITGDLVPTSTGLCWEDEGGKILPSIEGGNPAQAMRGMRIGVLLPNFSGCTIDPFSTEYWDVEPAPAPPSTSTGPLTLQAFMSSDELMPPPARAPLQPRAANGSTLDHMLVGAAQGMKGPINSVAATQGSKPGRKASAPKALSKEDLDEFKEAVVGSQLSKADLCKGLKARFPKLTQDTIKTTLGDKFAQVGASKADKKWVFVGDA